MVLQNTSSGTARVHVVIIFAVTVIIFFTIIIIISYWPQPCEAGSFLTSHQCTQPVNKFLVSCGHQNSSPSS
jgi:hypothetical protein